MAQTSTPAPLRLYFVRHGESEANILRVFSNRDLPHGLTETGRAQMERLAERLMGIPFTAMYASTQLRARQSADIVSARLGLKYTTTRALSEFDMGVLEGTSDPAGWRQHEALLEAWMIQRDWEARIEGGECFADIRARFVPFIDHVRRSRPPGSVLLLGHGAMLMCMLPELLSNVSHGFARERGLGHAEMVIAESRDDQFVCVSWGDSGAAGLRVGRPEVRG